MTSSILTDQEISVTTLSSDLRTHTAKAHEDAEQSDFMSSLLKGNLDQEAFIKLQEQLWLVYAALEAVVRASADDPRGAALLDFRLERTATLENDLDILTGGAAWREKVSATPATADYVARLEDIEQKKDFPRIVAHHYVRYLGDLSGGQVIARLVNREYDVPEEALSFYRFEELGKLKVYKDNYRAELDALQLTAPEREILLEEASDVFAFNQQLFQSLS